MLPKPTLISLLASLAVSATGAHAASADDWRDRSIYQVITDRFAGGRSDCPPSGGYCGGTWKSLTEKLDYIQGMGFSAVWISPTSKNIEGNTPYGQAYHGYWTQNPSDLNSAFGTSADLKALVSALHSRGMYIMVDVAINHIATTTANTNVQQMIDNDQGMVFRQAEQYHDPFVLCKNNGGYNDASKVDKCSLGDEKLPLVDVNTENDSVISYLNDYIKTFVAEYNIDGLRIDAARHVRAEFWGGFCQQSAGVFCTGEVYHGDPKVVGPFLGAGKLDSSHNFPLYYGFQDGFIGKKDMTQLTKKLQESQQNFPDATVMTSFLSNHDLPRFWAQSGDQAQTQSALAFQWIGEGIPILFYGEEQEAAISTKVDPESRLALYSSQGGLGSNNFPTDKPLYQHVKKLNQIRSYFGNTEKSSVLVSSASQAAFKRGNLVVVVTNGGSGDSGSYSVQNTGFEGSIVDLLTCETANASGGTISGNFMQGAPLIFARSADASASGVCGGNGNAAQASTGAAQPSASAPSSGNAVQTGNSAVGSAPAEGTEGCAAPPASSDAASGSSSTGNTPAEEPASGAGSGSVDDSGGAASSDGAAGGTAAQTSAASAASGTQTTGRCGTGRPRRTGRSESKRSRMNSS